MNGKETLNKRLNNLITDYYASNSTKHKIEESFDKETSKDLYATGVADGICKMIKWDFIVGSIAFVTCKIVKKIRA